MSGTPPPLMSCFLLLPSIHFVLKAEQFFRRGGLDHDLVPVPRKISTACGMALAFHCSDLAVVKQVLEEAGLPMPRLFRLDDHGDFHPLA